MPRFRHRPALLLAIALAACQSTGSPPLRAGPDDASYTAGRARLAQALAHEPRTGPAKNVIVFIGDGMDIVTVTAARIRAGQLAGGSGEEHLLGWERFPHVALAKTYNSNQQVPDSAGTATAMFAGVKTKAGVIGVGPEVLRSDCGSSQGRHVPSLLELAEKTGRSTGVVSTARITHATPAAAYAHGPERGWEHDAAIPPAEAAKGCVDFATQLVEFATGNGLEIALGGGRRSFVPKDDGGRRADGRDLIGEWRERSAAHAYVATASELKAIDLESTQHLLGLFTASHMSFEIDRPEAEPSLADMTRAAIRLLAQNPRGFVLQVEGGRIDHAHHQNNAHRALHETIALDQAIEVALELTNRDDTLLVVTADHGHTMTISGYPTRGNPILDVVRPNGPGGLPTGEPFLAADGKAYTTLLYANGPSAVVSKKGVAPCERPAPADPESASYQQQALIPMGYELPTGFTFEAETHGGQDVAIWATGPGAYLFQGTVEQSYVFHVIHHALRLGQPR